MLTVESQIKELDEWYRLEMEKIYKRYTVGSFKMTRPLNYARDLLYREYSRKKEAILNAKN